MITTENYHKHTYYSNIMTPDSAASYEDYAKRAVELGHKTLSCVEHGWQSKYHDCFEIAKKYNLKFVFGAEAYWVKDRHKKDRTNCHLILLAKNEEGRREINDILSEANLTGYYYRPRVDIELLLKLNPNNIVITTACIAGWLYDDANEIWQTISNHFGNNFYFEVQYHNTDKQKRLNKRIKELSNQLNIPLIVGLDSHYIYPEQAEEREYILAAKKVHYEDEDGWYMDYPDDDTVMNRFLEQDVFTKTEIQKAMDNTNIVLTFDDYAKENPIFSTDIKLPTLFDGNHSIDGKILPKLTQEEKNKLYSSLITQKFKEYIKDVPKELHQEYLDGVKNEVDVYKETGMVDYPLLDYYIVKEALKNGGLITATGRGSGASFFTNTLCGFSKVDRFTSPVKLYPERFISKERILETNSIPDLDINVASPQAFEEAQKKILGDNHAYPMIAFGTCKKKAAFKLYARSQNMDFDLANEISSQIEKYDRAYSNADDDEKEELDLYDYVDKKYLPYIEASQKYWGIIMDKKKAPCSYLLYSGDIRREIGLIKCKSESTNKECITTVTDGAVAEKYKFLKNDILTVSVVSLINQVYNRIGIKPHSVNELMELVDGDKEVWDIYHKGLTIGINQCEKDSTTNKLIRYKPNNVSELAAFIAAIRPAFKSMYSKLENREKFEYGIPAFDNLLQTPQFPQSFILYQEQTMNTLNYAGFPMGECYGIIKAIAKKHPEKVRPLKSKFIDGFKNRIINEESVDDTDAESMAKQVWQVISDSCNYGFNSAHAFCMALDSLYNAWQKAHYHYEFYEVLLQTFSDKGKKDKVSLLKAEMKRGFGIEEGEYIYGADNRRFQADKDTGVIYPSLLSIKGLSQGLANDLYSIYKELGSDVSFYELWKALKGKKSSNSAKIDILVEIGYFKNFADIPKLKTFIELAEDWYGRLQFKKDVINKDYLDIIIKNSVETELLYKSFNFDNALKEVWETIPDTKAPISDVLRYELEHFGFNKTTYKDIDYDIYFCQDCEVKFKNYFITLYSLQTGKILTVKVYHQQYAELPIAKHSILRAISIVNEGKWYKEGEDWKRSEVDFEKVLKRWNKIKCI